MAKSDRSSGSTCHYVKATVVMFTFAWSFLFIPPRACYQQTSFYANVLIRSFSNGHIDRSTLCYSTRFGSTQSDLLTVETLQSQGKTCRLSSVVSYATSRNCPLFLCMCTRQDSNVRVVRTRLVQRHNDCLPVFSVKPLASRSRNRRCLLLPACYHYRRYVE